MAESFDPNIEIPRNPDTAYAFESGLQLDSFEAGLLGGLAYAFCNGKCPALSKVKEAGLVCPFMITEYSQGETTEIWDKSDPSLAMLANVAINTWIHCVNDVRNASEPVILLDLKVDYSRLAF